MTAILGVGCGESGPSPEERARTAREQRLRETANEAERLLRQAAGLAATGNPSEAWGPWKDARALAGETPELARTRDIIRAAESRARREEELGRVRELIGKDNVAKSEAERIAALSEVEDRVRSFLERHPHLGPE